MIKNALSRDMLKAVIDKIFEVGEDADLNVRFRKGRFHWDFPVEDPTPEQVGRLTDSRAGR